MKRFATLLLAVSALHCGTAPPSEPLVVEPPADGLDDPAGGDLPLLLEVVGGQMVVPPGVAEPAALNFVAVGYRDGSGRTVTSLDGATTIELLFETSLAPGDLTLHVLAADADFRALGASLRTSSFARAAAGQVVAQFARGDLLGGSVAATDSVQQAVASAEGISPLQFAIARADGGLQLFSAAAAYPPPPDELPPDAPDTARTCAPRSAGLSSHGARSGCLPERANHEAWMTDDLVAHNQRTNVISRFFSYDEAGVRERIDWWAREGMPIAYRGSSGPTSDRLIIDIGSPESLCRDFLPLVANRARDGLIAVGVAPDRNIRCDYRCAACSGTSEFDEGREFVGASATTRSEVTLTNGYTEVSVLANGDVVDPGAGLRCASHGGESVTISIDEPSTTWRGNADPTWVRIDSAKLPAEPLVESTFAVESRVNGGRYALQGVHEATIETFEQSVPDGTFCSRIYAEYLDSLTGPADVHLIASRQEMCFVSLPAGYEIPLGTWHRKRFAAYSNGDTAIDFESTFDASFIQTGVGWNVRISNVTAAGGANGAGGSAWTCTFMPTPIADTMVHPLDFGWRVDYGRCN